MGPQGLSLLCPLIALLGTSVLRFQGLAGPTCPEDTKATDRNKASEVKGGPGQPGLMAVHVKSMLGHLLTREPR